MLVRPIAASVRVRIECQHLFVFRFGVGEFLLPFVQQTGREMRFGILRCEFGGFAVSRERLFRLGVFQQMRERQPGAGLTFFDVVRGLEVGGSAQIIARPRGC